MKAALNYTREKRRDAGGFGRTRHTSERRSEGRSAGEGPASGLGGSEEARSSALQPWGFSPTVRLSVCLPGTLQPSRKSFQSIPAAPRELSPRPSRKPRAVKPARVNGYLDAS